MVGSGMVKRKCGVFLWLSFTRVADLVRPHSAQLADAIIAVPEVATALEATLKRVQLSQAVEAPDVMVDDIKQRLDGKFPDGLQLFPFQYVGVGFIEAANGAAMIGDEMGVGKTIQLIGYAVLHPELWPCLVISPCECQAAIGVKKSPSGFPMLHALL